MKICMPNTYVSKYMNLLVIHPNYVASLAYIIMMRIGCEC